MTNVPEMFKPTEAAVISGVALRDVNRVIDRKLLPAALVRRGKMRGLSAEGCFYTAFYFGSAKRLTADERKLAIDTVHRRVGSPEGSKIGSPEGRKIWAALKPHCFVEDEFLQINLEPFLDQTHMRWDQYVAARETVTSSLDTLEGTPVFKGTRIPVHDVAASVAAGLSLDRILNAYPRLEQRHVAFAEIYAKANPIQGRPAARPILEAATLLSEETIARRPSQN